MNTGRYRAAYVSLEDEGKRFLAIGGQSSNPRNEKSVEIFDGNSWNFSPFDLPVTITAACAVLIGPNKVMVIGGVQGTPGKCLHILIFELNLRLD